MQVTVSVLSAVTVLGKLAVRVSVVVISHPVCIENEQNLTCIVFQAC